jgi:serine protease Do
MSASSRARVVAAVLTFASSAHAQTNAPAPSAAPPVKPALAPSKAPEKPAPSVSASAATIDKSGVVLVEQGGRVAELGIVLNGDGRILTALSRLGTGQLFVRYSTGALETVRIGHSDAARDLALLVPKTAKNQKGLKAADGALPQGSAKLSSFSLDTNRNLTVSPQTVQGMAELNGHAVIKLTSAPKPNELGGPLLDEHGDAAGIVVSGCPAGTAHCTAEPVVLPVSEVRAFLRTRPATAGFQLPRLGISGVSADNGVVRGLSISSVEAQSPAAALGLNPNENPQIADVLVAVSGTPVVTEDSLRRILARHVPGDRLDLLVFSKGAYRTVNVRLAPPSQAAPSAPNAPAPVAAPVAPKGPVAPVAPAAPKPPVASPAPASK